VQVCRDIDLWDAVQSVEEAGIGHASGVHGLAFVSLDRGAHRNRRDDFHLSDLSSTRR